jgi:short-subunit dehydrogenase
LLKNSESNGAFIKLGGDMQEMFSQGAVLIFGATGGIGQHVAMEFAKAGADLALIWRSKEDVAKRIAEQAEALGRKVSLHHCDVTEDGCCRESARRSG